MLGLNSNLDKLQEGNTLPPGCRRWFDHRVRAVVIFGLALLAAATPTRAQYLGSVSIQTVQQNLFPAGTVCTGSPQTATVNNLGQTSHTVVLLQGATATSIKFFLEGSNDGANFTRISDEYDGIQSGALQASGYYTVVRANVTCSPGTATFGMTYSGSGVPPSQPQGDGLRSQVEKVIAQAISTTGNQNFGLRSPYGNTAGLLQFTTSGGTFSGAAAVTVTCTLLSGQSTTVLNSTALSGATQLITVPASPCVSLVIGYTQGTSTGNMTIEYVFSAGFSGAAGTGATGTGGCVADGTAPCNPLVVAGVTSPGSSVPGVTRYVTALAENANDLSVGNLNVRGLAIGAGNINPQGQTTGTTLPNVGPIGAAVTGVRTDLSTGTNNPLSATPAAGFSYGVNSQSQANNSGPGLLTNQNGFSILTTAVSVTANGNQNVTNFPAWDVGTFDSCYVTVTTGTPTGTAPTLDVHFQSSTDGTNFTDRIHFTQITTTASTQKQVAGIVTGIGGITPTAISNGLELAAGAILNGPIGAWLRFQFVIGGSASPTFPTTQFGVVCH